MAFRKVQINFTVVDPRGWVSGSQIIRELDDTIDLLLQMEAEVFDWIDRRKRVHGQDLRLGKILSGFFEKGGFWFVREAGSIQWESK